MADRDDTLLPLPGWANALEQLSLPLRAYQQQLMRTYEPALRFGEQFWQAYGGWLRYWERFVYWEQLVAGEGSAFEVPVRMAEQWTPIPSASREAAQVDVPPDAERFLADLAGMLEVVRVQLERLTASLNDMLAEQLKLLGEAVGQYHAGPAGEEKHAEG